MLSSLTFLAEVTGAGEAPSGITKIAQDFGLSVPLFLAQVLSFSIAAFVLWKFAFKPVLATLGVLQAGLDLLLAFVSRRSSPA
jgi:F-type H+-transporting ATPase subunit b